MAVLKKYDRQYHDLYKYNPMVSAEPKYDGIPFAINPDCEAIKAGLDFSGCVVRNQRFNNRSSPNNFPGVDWYDINMWNNGYFAAVLITPRHALVCEHYYATVPSQIHTMKWLGRSGIFHSRAVEKTKPMGSDLRLVEFKDDFPADIKVYNRIADIRYIPINTQMWIQDAQNRIYRVLHARTTTNTGKLDGDPTGWSSKTYLDGPEGYNQGFYQYGGGPTNPSVFAGDSGSPTFILDEGETILVGLAFGGTFISPKMLDQLKYETGNRYPLELVKVSAKKSDVNQDGSVDAADLADLSAAWGTSNPKYDLNGDGVVDAMDMTILQADWGYYGLTHSVYTPPVAPPLPITPPKDVKR